MCENEVFECMNELLVTPNLADELSNQPDNIVVTYGRRLLIKLSFCLFIVLSSLEHRSTTSHNCEGRNHEKVKLLITNEW